VKIYTGVYNKDSMVYTNKLQYWRSAGKYWILFVIYSGNNNKCSAAAEMGNRLATVNMGRKLGAVPILGRGVESPCNTMRHGPSLIFVPSGIFIPSSRLATTDMGRNLGAVPLGGWSWVHI